MFGFFCPKCGKSYRAGEAERKRSCFCFVDLYCTSCEGEKLTPSGRQMLFLAAVGWIFFYHALQQQTVGIVWAVLVVVIGLVQIVRHRRAVEAQARSGEATPEAKSPASRPAEQQGAYAPSDESAEVKQAATTGEPEEEPKRQTVESGR